MPKTYIAFSECTFYGNWIYDRELIDPEAQEEHTDPRECHIADVDGASIVLVDLNGKRRTFTFNKGGVVEILGNLAMMVEWHLQEPDPDKHQ